jgi:putative DNA primase/helicase
MSSIDDLIKKAEASPIDADIQELAKLSSYQYQSIREESAKHLGLKLGALDEAVKEMKAELKNSSTNTESYFEEVIPFDGEVDTCELLDETRNFLNTYLFLPKYADVIITLWIAHTHVFRCFKYSPRLIITSSDPESGKSMVLDVSEQLVPKPLMAHNITASAFCRIVELEHPTLLLDEYDTYMKGNEDIRGIINAGQKFNGKYIKSVRVGDNYEPASFSCYCPVALAGIGKLHATIQSRSHVIKMKPAKEFEVSKEFDLDDIEDVKLLASKLAKWALDNKGALKTAKPKLHGSLKNRKKDSWKPFYAIAELAGQKWIDLANNTVIATRQSRSLTFKENFLADIRYIFEENNLEQIPSKSFEIGSEQFDGLADKLMGLELRDYANMFDGRGITPNNVANWLHDYDIKPKRINFYVESQRTQKRGYIKDMFEDAWDRHLNIGNENIIPFPAEVSAQSVTTSQVNAGNGFNHSASVTSLICVTPKNDHKGNASNGCDTVTPSPSSEGVCNECRNLQKDVCTEGSSIYQATKDGECVDFVYKR